MDDGFRRLTGRVYEFTQWWFGQKHILEWGLAAYFK
jgi:hypothetical protein